MQFDEGNTQGYTSSELRILNDVFDDVANRYGRLDPFDVHTLGEMLLTEFDNGHRTRDALRRVVLRRFGPAYPVYPSHDNPPGRRSSSLSPRKAREMLAEHDYTSDRQRRFLGARSSGEPVRRNAPRGQWRVWYVIRNQIDNDPFGVVVARTVADARREAAEVGGIIEHTPAWTGSRHDDEARARLVAQNLLADLRE